MPNQSPNILLVDDHEDGLQLYASFLRSLGYRVSATQIIAEAREACSAERFDLLILDVRLRDGSGRDLLRDLRATCNMPAIAISGLAGHSDVEESLAAGFALHIAKPIDLDVLQKGVAHVLGRQGELSQSLA